MKRIILQLIAFTLLNGSALAQLKSVTAFADYSFASAKRLTIDNADAVGGGIIIKYKIAGNLNIGLTGGYKLYSLNEPDVLNTWGWIFWTDRYYNKIISDLAADPNLSVEIGAVQKMDLIPVILFAEYGFDLGGDIILTPSAGGGVYFFNRRMYAVENWTKRFPSADYSFNYQFRNFAPSKSGNPFLITSGLEIKYLLFETLSLFGSAGYVYIIPTEGSLGYDEFPFENEFSFKFGFVIKY